MSIPFISENVEMQLSEQIGEMRQSGVAMCWDPSTLTSIHVLVHVREGLPPQLTRWVCQGPTSLEVAKSMTSEIEAAVRADEERISMGQSIN